MSKHISKTMEWDEVVHLATAVSVWLYAELFLGMCHHQSVEVFYESGRVNCVERILD